MKLVFVAAHDPNLVIGNKGDLPWNYPADMKHFKETTMGGIVLMGRKVYESLRVQPLPKRRNIVLSRTKIFSGVETYTSLDEAFENIADDETVFVIGGGEIYKELMPRADELIITLIKKSYAGDVFFPEYRDEIGTTWKENIIRETDELIFYKYTKNNSI